MTGVDAAVIALLLAVVAIVGVVVQAFRFHASQAKAWAQERRELLNRVQRPEVIPQAAPEMWAMPEMLPDESNLVGTVAEPREES